MAWRNLRKNRAYSIINIGGMALGMAVALIIGLWINSELSFNSYFGNKDRIAQVYQSQTFNGTIQTMDAVPRPLEKALRETYGDRFDHVVVSSHINSEYLKYGETSISKTGFAIQPEAPEMLDLKILKGDRNGLKDINAIMLSASVANALFGDADPIGKTVTLNSTYPMKVSAVYEDIPENNSFHDMQYMKPWSHYVANNQWVKNAEDSWGNNSFLMYVQLADNAAITEVDKAIRDVKLNQRDGTEVFHPQIFLFPMNDWHLRADFEDGKQVGGRITYVWLFGFVGLFVLLLACINFMNLSTAKSEKRAKEVGVRKAIGSYRGQLVNQFLGESFMVVALSFVLAVIGVLLSLKAFGTIAQKTLAFPWTNIWFWMVALGFIAITALLSGSYPALYLSSFKPVDVLKGTFKSGRYSALPRKILVVFQFTVSVAFIIGTLIVVQQLQYAKNRPIGYNRDGLVQVPTMSADFFNKYDLMRTEFLNSGAITAMASSSSPTTEIWENKSGFDYEGKPDGFQMDLAWTHISPEFAPTVGMTILEGRNFSRDMPSDSTAVLINRTAQHYLGLEHPIGMLLRDNDPENPKPPLKIIGVVEDMVAQSPYRPVKQAVYQFYGGGAPAYYLLRLNPKQSAQKDLATLEDVFKAHFPDIPFQYAFVDQEYGAKFAAEERIGQLSSIFTVLAIVISCLGLFGLTSFVAEQRTKEIGVRKVLGATILNIWHMLSKDFLALVAISCAVAMPIAYFIMRAWLQEFPYRIALSWWIFGLAILGAFLVTLVTVSFQAIRAARTNPVKSLRTE